MSTGSARVPGAAGRVGRVAAALGAAALALVGVVATDVPGSVVTASTVVHLDAASAPALGQVGRSASSDGGQ